MADVMVGDIVGRLRIDTAEWQRGLQQAMQSLQQFGQAKDRIISNLSGLRQALTQNAQTFQQFTAQVNQTNQTFNQTNQTLNNIRQTFTQFNTQLTQTNQTFNQTTQTITNFNTQITATTTNINHARSAASGFGSAWGAVLQIAGGIGLATSIQGIVSSLRSLAIESVQAAARMETLRAQFTALQGAGQGAATLQGLFQTAQRLGVEFGTLATGFRQFAAATQGTALEGAKAQRVFEQITTGMRGMGTSSEQVGRALLALQQMVSKGTVSQEELRQQLGEALPGAMGIAARAFGVTTQEMNKMIEKGLDAVQFVQLFGAQVEREFGGKAAIATNSLTAAWQRLTNEFEQFKGALVGEELSNSLRQLTEWATTFLETMREAREAREAAMGGPSVPLPREMRDIASLQTRQREIEDLRRTIREEGRNLPGVVISGIFGGKTREEAVAEAREALLELQKVQREAIKRLQEQWQAEALPPATVAQLPGQRVTEAMRKIQEDLQKTLREIDLTGAFVTPLERAEARLKAIEDSFKRMQEEARRLGAGLRESLTPSAAKPSPYDDLIAEAAARHGIPYNIARALVQQESGFDPTAKSRAGAMGLTQLMPGTARQMGLAPGEEFDPARNLDAGLKYLSQLLDQFRGDWQRALTAYNAGPGRGGIPLPTGENATFAARVLGIAGPVGPGTLLSNLAAQRRAAEAAVEAEKPDPENLRRIMAIGKEDEERRAKAARDAEQDQATYQAAIDKTRMALAQQQDQAVQTLDRLASAYQHTSEQQDRLTAGKLAAQFPENEEIRRKAELVMGLSEEAEANQQAFIAIKQRTDALREAADAEEQVLRRGRESVEQTREQILGTPRQSTRLRQQMERTPMTEEGEREARAILVQQQQLERVIYAVEIWRDLSSGVGSAWTQALSSIADGTRTVSEAFREMGKSIMKTMADIAAQQAFQAIFKLGTGLLLGALMPTVTPAAAGTAAYGAAEGTTSFPAGAFYGGLEGYQHGGVVTAPTVALLGEVGREHVVPGPHYDAMQAAMRSAGSSGNQGSSVVVMNFPGRQQAEQAASQQRALGKEVVLNEVLNDLSAGSGSKIGRAMRLLQQ